MAPNSLQFLFSPFPLLQTLPGAEVLNELTVVQHGAAVPGRTGMRHCPHPTLAEHLNPSPYKLWDSSPQHHPNPTISGKSRPITITLRAAWKRPSSKVGEEISERCFWAD